MTLDQLLTDARPFGPEDQALIDNLTDAVHLTGLYGPLSTAITGSHVLISGRKGCGKSALISMLRGYEFARPRLQREKIKIDHIHGRTRFINISTWNEFLVMNTNVRRYLADGPAKDMLSDPHDYQLIPTEAVETAWVNEIWERIFQSFYEGAHGDDNTIDQEAARELRKVLMCFDDEKMASMRGTPEYVASKVFQEAKGEVEDICAKLNMVLCILFDSMEKYPLANPTFMLSMSGFLRAINTIVSKHSFVKIVFALPEEIIPHIRESSSNILKDFNRAFTMRWKPRDLWRIAAFRYRLFLSLHDEQAYAELQMGSSDWSDRRQLRDLYKGLMPDTVTNAVGIEESALAYVIRHTFLAPRHILTILNRAALESYRENQHWRSLSASSLVKGVRAAEQDIADEVFVPFEGVYRGLKASLKKSLAGLPPVFKYGSLDKAISKISKEFSMDDAELVRLLFHMGIIGRISMRGNSGGDQKYCLADFFFNSTGNVVFSGSDELCFHPVFSTYYNADTRRGGDKRIIYPRGIEAEIQEQSD